MQKASNCEDELCHHSHETCRKPPSPAPVSTIATKVKPATVPAAAKSIRSTNDLIKEFPDQFTGIGRFPGKYKIWLWHDIHPMIHAPRKCPIALCPKVKEHLNKIKCLGVITCVDEPRAWASSITYVQKANGKLCPCLDPHDLSETICWDHHKMPTVEEVIHEFAHSHFFTKLDAHQGYWSIILNQESSLLMTFNSPFGRYCFLQLPFGLICSQDIFQKKMDHILEECQAASESQMTSPSMAAPRQNMMPAYETSCRLPTNTIWCLIHKTHVKAQTINFFGCLYDANGVHPDLGKVNAICALPVPTNVTELQKFLGLVMYLSPFIPGLSTLTAPLQELLKKGTDFTWNPTYDATFQWSKKLSSVTPSSGIWPFTCRDNTSQCLTGRPWCSTPAKWQTHSFCQQGPYQNKCQYVNIEREMLAAIFGVERFWMYVYGRSFTIESDPKPLESISQRTWQTCQPICSTCYCASRAMITPSVTAPVRRWPYPTHSLSSVHILDLTSHWTLPSTMLTCPQRGRKHSNKSL